MQIKCKRAASFWIVAIVYIIAGAAGILTYGALPFAPWLSLLLADIAATVAVFLFSLLFGNASVYDPYWSVQPIVILLAYIAGKTCSPGGLLITGAITLWGLRLTANWAYTFHGLGHQDWRYTMLKEQTGLFYPLINFIGIHMVPTLIVYGCTLPAVYALAEGGGINIGCLLGCLLSLSATALQGVADWQMQRFRKARTGFFIRQGLWKYSRHPNYLGEILMWWGVALATLSLIPHRPWLMLGAAANTLLFFCVSLPMAEKRQSKKPGFAAYKAETRLLLPLKK